jgi:hypothetical protein
VILQITVSDTHSVKANGLTRIVNAYSSYANITNLSLVFVTPLRSDVVKVQKITTQKGIEMVLLPVVLQPLRQYKLEYELSSH